MTPFHLTTTLLGFGLAITIIALVRRDKLQARQGVFWIFVAAAAALLGVWPGLIDRLALTVGISYAPTLLLLAAVIVLLIKSLQSDIELARLERQLRRLNQRLALSEFERPNQKNPDD
ncbi:DUF2304 domain-containing protein [Azoarcus sp. L1K30]|uniref:DUF2304 domain-containing protein n=1 Tax=Azoarcus sp. L1K30 TaxID=2820277 RepID=UPI001B82ADAF|nr:DUF2304 domain-containing protein [Azoarcus sp. L1K30]MBR0566012.1 DUF2304 domain-containing protein [Azoarcus sp. L1K30]